MQLVEQDHALFIVGTYGSYPEEFEVQILFFFLIIPRNVTAGSPINEVRVYLPNKSVMQLHNKPKNTWVQWHFVLLLPAHLTGIPPHLVSFTIICSWIREKEALGLKQGLAVSNCVGIQSGMKTGHKKH